LRGLKILNLRVIFTFSGKKYIFDIERTLQEACDHARRVLYSAGSDAREIMVRKSAEEAIVDTTTACDSKQHLKVNRRVSRKTLRGGGGELAIW